MNRLKQRAYKILRKSEKYTRTDMVYAFSSSFWVTAAQTAATLFSIPLSIAFAHFLTPNEYGLYKYVLAVASVIGVFSLTGIGTAITRSTARGFDGGLYQGLLLSLRSNAVVVLISTCTAAYYFLQANSDLGIALLIVAFGSPFFNSSNFFGSYLNGRKDFKAAGFYNTYRNLFSVLIVLGSVVLTANPLVVLAAYFTSYSASGLFLTWYVHKRYARNDTNDPESPAFSFHSSVINGLTTLADKLDSILLFQFVGAAQLAIYSFAELVPEALNRFGKIFNTIALPKYAQNPSTVGIVRKTLLISLLFLPITISYIFAAPYIFSYFFPMYMEAVPFSQLLALMLLLNGTLPVAYLDAQAAIKNKYLLSIMSSVIKLLLVGIGVLVYGLWGAVLGRLASKFLGVALGVGIVKFSKE